MTHELKITVENVTTGDAASETVKTNSNGTVNALLLHVLRLIMPGSRAGRLPKFLRVDVNTLDEQDTEFLRYQILYFLRCGFGGITDNKSRRARVARDEVCTLYAAKLREDGIRDVAKKRRKLKDSLTSLKLGDGLFFRTDKK